MVLANFAPYNIRYATCLWGQTMSDARIGREATCPNSDDCLEAVYQETGTPITPTVWRTVVPRAGGRTYERSYGYVYGDEG